MIRGSLLLAVVTASITCTQAFAWDGTNATTGSSVEIERGQLVRSGRTIEVYDSDQGYKEYDVDSTGALAERSRSRQQTPRRARALRLKWMTIELNDLLVRSHHPRPSMVASRSSPRSVMTPCRANS